MRPLLLGLFLFSSITLSGVTKEECDPDILFRFFPQSIVSEVFKKNDVDPVVAEKITKDLEGADIQVVEYIGKKAQSMNPNPLVDLSMSEERSALFKEAITTTFLKITNQDGFTDDAKAKEMLDEIQNRRLELFEECHKSGLIER